MLDFRGCHVKDDYVAIEEPCGQQFLVQRAPRDTPARAIDRKRGVLDKGHRLAIEVLNEDQIFRARDRQEAIRVPIEGVDSRIAVSGRPRDDVERAYNSIPVQVDEFDEAAFRAQRNQVAKVFALSHWDRAKGDALDHFVVFCRISVLEKLFHLHVTQVPLAQAPIKADTRH